MSSGDIGGHSMQKVVSGKMYDCSGASGQGVRETMWEFNVNSPWGKSLFSVLSPYLGKDITYIGRQFVPSRLALCSLP